LELPRQSFSRFVLVPSEMSGRFVRETKFARRRSRSAQCACPAVYSRRTPSPNAFAVKLRKADRLRNVQGMRSTMSPLEPVRDRRSAA